ncbi:1-acyl-sn-glycerol-3-phosphate acyltransferase [Marinomonas piezotolerans]|uniref:1-acyl-sn-glycerol-3-phosphate acyltransferase n=1 Tax=Marinomonas piezotolerans TaxID=2213058 RepID=A0A370UCC3_9GAMM|nr:1-acylglycerol-3-phosphate O-acyltransferase [Marinomonas piezotolerans]RDL45434.1 1-acyl-sn-glycerol-3-phosphate acyltransferase [Marinomonas piezotolerans]
MIAVIRLTILICLIVLVTALGLLLCLVLGRSKDRVYYVAKTFAPVARLFGLRVSKHISYKSLDVPQAVYIGNHQNNYDLFTFSHVVPRGVVTVGKSSLRWLPFFGWLYWASGNFLIHRQDRDKAIATIGQIVANMRESGLSIWMFPEGTRSRGRGWLPFKRGAFHAAIQAQVPIIPVVCSSTHAQVKLNRLNNGAVKVEVLDPIYTDGMTEKDIPALVSRCEEVMKAKQAELDQSILIES